MSSSMSSIDEGPWGLGKTVGLGTAAERAEGGGQIKTTSGSLFVDVSCAVVSATVDCSGNDWVWSIADEGLVVFGLLLGSAWLSLLSAGML